MALDTNILLDAFTGSPAEISKALQALSQAIHADLIMTSSVCYADLAKRFANKGELDDLLLGLECAITQVDTHVAFLAGRFFNEYRARGANSCRLSDSYDASLHADRILTSDKRFFGTHFPGLRAVAYDDLEPATP